MNLVKHFSSPGNDKPAKKRKRPYPTIFVAVPLSIASLGWTAWSIYDLMHTGPAALALALSADLIWGGVLFAEWKGTRLIPGWKWSTPIAGLLLLGTVIALLLMHGLEKNNAAMCVAAFLLPIGAKVMWLLTIEGSRDPSDLTDDEKLAAAEKERENKVIRRVGELEGDRMSAKHEAELRKIQREAEIQLELDNANARIIANRQKLAVELQRIAPMPMPTFEAPEVAAPASRRSVSAKTKTAPPQVTIQLESASKVARRELARLYYQVNAQLPPDERPMPHKTFYENIDAGVQYAQFLPEGVRDNMPPVIKPAYFTKALIEFPESTFDGDDE